MIKEYIEQDKLMLEKILDMLDQLELHTGSDKDVYYGHLMGAKSLVTYARNELERS